jgi:hypothetical protein
VVGAATSGVNVDHDPSWTTVRRVLASWTRYAPVNRYSVCQASVGSVWAVQNSSAMLSGSNAVPRTTEPTIVTGCGMDAVLLDTGGDQGRRRAQGGLPDRQARQCGHRMVGEAAAGKQQCAGAGGPQDGCGDLGRDDGAEDIDVIRGPEPADRRVQDLARIRQGSVVHDDARDARGVEDPLERRTVAVQIFNACAHRLDLSPIATQLRDELLERFVAGDECAAEAW